MVNLINQKCLYGDTLEKPGSEHGWVPSCQPRCQGLPASPGTSPALTSRPDCSPERELQEAKAGTAKLSRVSFIVKV